MQMCSAIRQSLPTTPAVANSTVPNFCLPNFISLLDLDPVLLGLFDHPAEIADDLLRYAFPQ